MAAGGLLALALRFREEGKARFLGLSGHKLLVALEAARSGQFDVLMFPINPAFDAIPGEASPWEETPERGAARAPARRELYHLCAGSGVGLVAMKPFAGGALFRKKDQDHAALTPVQCLSYVLSQPGVSSVVPGVKNQKELRGALRFLAATAEEKDFSLLVAGSAWGLQGSCVYCNHCPPCPEAIDVGRTLRLLDTAQHGVSDSLRGEYGSLPAAASACAECGACRERCPFGVEVIEKMKQAAGLFEA